jgi:hypothetical protein
MVQEHIHSLKSSCKPGLLIKLDLAKAYDSLSWDCIVNILQAFGFSPPWIKWIMSLISIAFFSILVNGSPSTTFSPSRGIHQGDPLSPFLFIIMEEGLGNSIQETTTQGKWKGINLQGMKNQQHINNLWMKLC